jgi:hypothetical protein
MWFNGFLLTIDRALAQAANPLLTRHRDAIVLGCFREDVWYVPLLGAVVQNPSLDHFARARLPGGFVPWLTRDAGDRAQALGSRAVRAMRERRLPRAMVELGRAAHAVIDMACPVHAQGKLHGSDAFEWCVEAMSERIAGLADAPVVRCANFAAAARGLARHAQFHAIARTQSQAREQALALMPLAASHTRALFDRFLEEAGDVTDDCDDPVAAALAELDMPRAGLATWFGQLASFAAAHGGERHYAELLGLVRMFHGRVEGSARLAHG